MVGTFSKQPAIIKIVIDLTPFTLSTISNSLSAYQSDSHRGGVLFYNNSLKSNKTLQSTSESTNLELLITKVFHFDFSPQ